MLRHGWVLVVYGGAMFEQARKVCMRRVLGVLALI